MARSLLIALMSVVAVAGPATALSPLGLPEPPGPPPLDGALAIVDEQGATVACGIDACSDAVSIARCRPYSVNFDQNNWPNFQAEYDPDYCIRRLIDETIDWPPYPVRLFLDRMADDEAADDAAETDPSTPE